MYDVIIIGSGPAGLTSAIYLLRANRRVLILEKESIGGQIISSSKVSNYPGFGEISGMELMDNLYNQVVNLGGEVVLEEALEIKNGDVNTVITDSGSYKAKTVILAVGSKNKLLGIEREEEFVGNGISFCVSCDGAFYQGKMVAVVGGGNSAVGEALSLADICKKVYVIQKLDELTCEETLKEKIKGKDNIEIFYNSEVVSYLGDKDVNGIIIKCLDKEIKLDVDGVFLAIGLVPSTSFIENLLTLDKNNYILSDDTITDKTGIFVAGDCRSKKYRQLTTAVSDGTVAALNAINYLNN